MNKTTNYELLKPESTDFYDIDDFNDNADAIDTLIYTHGEGATQNNNPAGTDFLQMIGGSDSKVYKALVSDIADTILRKLAISTSETGLVNGSVMKLINSLNSNTQLTLTRSEQSYVDATQFGRLVAVKKGTMLTLFGNLSANYGSGFSDFVTIGKITGWSAVGTSYMNVPSQTDGSKVLVVSVTSDGYIKIYSGTEFTGSPWFRFTLTTPSA